MAQRLDYYRRSRVQSFVAAHKLKPNEFSGLYESLVLV